MNRSCATCNHATWQLTPTRKIKRNLTGHCDVPIPDLSTLVAACIVLNPPHKVRIWPDMGKNCPSYELKK